VIKEDCKRFGAHNMRHGLATYLVKRGNDPELVAKMLRQSHVDTALIYIHNQKEARAAQADFLGEFLPANGHAKRVQ
jgi:site-specific recombinase XerD